MTSFEPSSATRLERLFHALSFHEHSLSENSRIVHCRTRTRLAVWSRTTRHRSVIYTAVKRTEVSSGVLCLTTSCMCSTLQIISYSVQPNYRQSVRSNENLRKRSDENLRSRGSLILSSACKTIRPQSPLRCVACLDTFLYWIIH